MSSPCAAPTPGRSASRRFIAGASTRRFAVDFNDDGVIDLAAARLTRSGASPTSSGSRLGARGARWRSSPRHRRRLPRVYRRPGGQKCARELIRPGCNRSARTFRKRRERARSSSRRRTPSEYRIGFKKLLRHHAVQPQRVLRRCGQRSRQGAAARLRARANSASDRRQPIPFADLEVQLRALARRCCRSPRSLPARHACCSFTRMSLLCAYTVMKPFVVLDDDQHCPGPGCRCRCR